MEATIVSTFTQNKSLEQPSHGDYVDTWEIPVNLDWSEIDTAFGGSSLLNSTGLSGDTALTATQYRPLSLLISGTPTGTITYVVPSGVGGQWVFVNGTAGDQTVGIKSGAGGSTVTVAAGLSVIVSCDGSASGMRKSITEPAIAAGATGQIQYYASGVLGATGGLTWTTASATSPTGALGVTGSISASGTITSTTGGFVFPDATVQQTAAWGGVTRVSATGNVPVVTADAFLTAVTLPSLGASGQVWRVDAALEGSISGFGARMTGRIVDDTGVIQDTRTVNLASGDFQAMSLSRIVSLTGGRTFSLSFTMNTGGSVGNSNFQDIYGATGATWIQAIRLT